MENNYNNNKKKQQQQTKPKLVPFETWLKKNLPFFLELFYLTKAKYSKGVDTPEDVSFK